MTNTKLTEPQKALLTRGGAFGIRMHGKLVWSRSGKRIGSATIGPLLENGLMESTELPGGTAAAKITDAGRQALVEANTGRVRLDEAVAAMAGAVQ